MEVFSNFLALGLCQTSQDSYLHAQFMLYKTFEMLAMALVSFVSVLNGICVCHIFLFVGLCSLSMLYFYVLRVEKSSLLIRCCWEVSSAERRHMMITSLSHTSLHEHFREQRKSHNLSPQHVWFSFGNYGRALCISMLQPLFPHK